MNHQLTSRRSVLAAAGMAGLAATLVSCGDSGDGSDDGDGEGGGYGDGGGADDEKESDGEADDEEGGDPGNGGDGDGGGALGRVAEIPEGGGKVFEDRKVVVTQPSAGEFKAFSATCQHKGCLVNEVSGGTINCPCHGSKYDISDGSVKAGPARRSLPGKRVSVKDGTVRLA
ncbi:Rieske (2Fe-2S) protein [Streptomyces albiaxialis]|uniref:Cytochrome bc1 complex Rieske iron-sulfur subunit n=1 Tax=Streptomyces albiaxialis TaxID=329523 RepID=A0ABN2VNW9_9ACTN